MWTYDSPDEFTISANNLDCPGIFPFFILPIGSLSMTLSMKQCDPNAIFIKQYDPKTIFRITKFIPCELPVQKLFVIIFLSYFLIFITCCQHNITIPSSSIIS